MNSPARPFPHASHDAYPSDIDIEDGLQHFREPEQGGDTLPVVVYTDSVIQVGEATYEIDEVGNRFLRILSQNPQGAYRLPTINKIFVQGNFGSASEAQANRFDATINYLAGIEEETDTLLFSATFDDARQDVVYGQAAPVRFLRRPSHEEPQEIPTPNTESKVGILDEQQRKLVEVLTSNDNYDPNYDGRIYRSTVSCYLFGQPQATFEQDVSLNQTIQDLNAWLAAHGIKFEVRRVITHSGPALQIDNIFALDELPSEIEKVDKEIMEAQESERAQQGIALSALAQNSHSGALKRKDTPMRPRVATRKTIAPSPSHVRRSTLLSNPIMERDYRFGVDISTALNLGTQDVMSVRRTLGEALATRKLPSAAEQAQIICFIQCAERLAQDDGKSMPLRSQRELARWVDASWGVMILAYQEKIDRYARRLSRRSDEEARRSLETAGAHGLYDGIRQFARGHEAQPSTYLSIKIFGAMVDFQRRTIEGPGRGAKKKRFASLDAPTFDPDTNTLQEDITLGDVLAGGGDPSESLDAFQDPSVEIISKAMEKILNNTRRNPNIGRDVQIVKFYFGLTSMMTEEEMALYDQLPKRDDGQVVYRTLASAFGVTESRVSQIITTQLPRLRAILREAKDAAVI